MNRINGNPSVFLAVDIPTPNAPVENWFSQYVAIANQMAREAEAEWLADEATQAEYQAYLESVDSSSEADFDAEMDRQAEEYELQRLGSAYMEAINGHDLKWQAGGTS